MNRQEAVTCLKEITAICGSMSPDAISLVNSKPDNPLSTGYQLHIQTVLDGETKRQVQIIAEKNSLALKEEKGQVIIYRPKEVTKTL
jgi:hypothetical protein